MTGRKTTKVGFRALPLFLFIALSLTACNSSEPEPAPLNGYFQTIEGIVETGSGNTVLQGEFSEAVANEGYLLTTDNKGTLTLTRIADKKTIKLENADGAYQLKAVGDHFGYLQQHDDAQYITFLNPETGETAAMETANNVITWDAEGTSISYHLYETGIIGFAKYSNSLGWNNNKETDEEVDTLGQIFSQDGKNYVWVLSNKTDYRIYSLDSKADVTDEFPAFQQLEMVDGTLSEIIDGSLVLTADVQGSDEASTPVGNETQVWNMKGEQVLNLTITGYEFTGDANEGNGSLYLPVSYTGGSTPDGLLIVNPNDYTTSFEEGALTFVSE